MDKNEPKWTKMNLKWTQKVLNGPKWITMDQIGPEWFKMDNIGLKWTTMAQIGVGTVAPSA